MTVSTQAQLPGDNALVLLPEVATRNLNMVKLQGGTGSVCTAPAPNTTTPAKEIVMPSYGIPPAIDAAIRETRRAFGLEQPSPPKRQIPHRRGRIKRGGGPNAWARVYFAGCSCCGLIKIGFSRDYRKRMAELEARSGHRGLTVLGTSTGDREIEAAYHFQFLRDRVEGEWFRPSGALMAHIREHTVPAGWRGY